MKTQLRIPFIRSIVFVVFMIAVTAGCSNFDHPLPWSHSPIHAELPGSWHAVHESEPPLPIEISMNESGSLSVDMMVMDTEESEESDSTQTSGNQVHRVTFQGDVLLSNGVHVLRIDMRTYKEHEHEDKESNSPDRDGYRFLRVLSEEDSVVFQKFDIEQVARHAEERFFAEDVTFTDSEFASCVNHRIRSGIGISILAELLKERPTNWLSEVERSELEKELKEFETRTVNPYQQLQKVSECIAYKLPGDLLGQLFSADPAELFSGETIRVVRTK
ncbi:MAG: hypothetical protein OXG05_11915 [Gammaproteobacteria bacterium]|nr:hypothetical protein [Gammaproteobacteria bacterium]